MKAEVRFESEAATVVFADETVDFEVRTRDIAEAESLRGRAKADGLFLVEAEDPQLSNFHIYIDEPVPEEIEEVCFDRSGSFLLRVPSGRFSMCASRSL